MALTLTFDQPDAGIPAGVVDRARTDLSTDGNGEVVRAYPVFITVGGVPSGATADVTLLDEPPAANPLLTQLSAAVWKLEFDQGAWGPFRVRARALSSGTVLSSVTRRCSVRSPKLGFQYPANAERIDPNATKVASVQSIALTEMNEGGTNRALVDFYRELIERTEAAIADGTIVSPPLFESLYDDSIEHIDAKYRVSAQLQAWAALANTARQLRHGNDYPIEKYTPGAVLGEAPLTDANFAQSIRNAVTAAQVVQGGNVILPRGVWNVGDEDIVLLSLARGNNVSIVGAGMDETVLVYPTGYAGEAFFFKGTPSPPAAADLYYNGGMRDLTIACATIDASNVGVAIRCESAIGTRFRNVTIRNFTGGTGLKATKYPPDYTSQYVQLRNFTVSGCNHNYDLTGFVNCVGYGVFSHAAVSRDFLIDDTRLAIYGGNIQSSAPIAVEFAGAGGCQLALHDFYHEGFGAVMFKLNVPSSSANQLYVHGFHLGGSPSIFVDVDVFNAVALQHIDRIANATTILKARTGPSVLMIASGDPVSLPGKFDLDPLSETTLTCVGTSTYTNAITAHTDITATRRLVAGQGVGLPSFATDAEPSGTTGDLVRDSSLERPTYKTASSGWRRVALSTDDNDLTALLTPYAAEIWDPSVYRSSIVIAGELDALTGLVNGSSAAAPAAGQRPTWNASDAVLGGRPSFTCALTGDHYLSATLAVPIAVGSRPALFAVYRCLPGTNDPINRRLACQAEHAADHSSGIAIGQSDSNASDQAYGFAAGAAGVAFGVGATGTDPFGHVAYICSDAVAGTKYCRDAEAISAPTSDPGLSTSTVDRVVLGGAWGGAAYVGCNLVLGYAAALFAPLDEDTRLKAMRAAMSRFALR